MAALIVLVGVHAAQAQQPSQEELNSIRSSCRSDFMANCSGVTPGGKDALDCLRRNLSKLSSSCQTAVNAIAPKPAEQPPVAKAEPAPAEAPAAKPAAAPAESTAKAGAAEDEELKAVQKACTLNDLVAHCSSIAPSSPAILPCLKANAAKLSPGCQTALGSAKPAAAAPAKKPAEASRSAMPPPPSAPTAAAPVKPSSAQTAAIRSACRSDFMSQCAGVQPGGAEALQCLQRNAAKLSAPCKSAVAAIGGGAPAAAPGAAPAAPAESAAAPAVAPLTPKPFMLPRQRLVIVAICNNDARTLCAGVPPGGGEIIACLAANAAKLSPECYSALARESR
jgi:hypothetical protein